MKRVNYIVLFTVMLFLNNCYYTSIFRIIGEKKFQNDIEIFLSLKNKIRKNNAVIYLNFINHKKDTAFFCKHLADGFSFKYSITPKIGVFNFLKERNYFKAEDVVKLPPRDTLSLPFYLSAYQYFEKKGNFKLQIKYFNRIDTSKVYDTYEFPEFNFTL